MSEREISREFEESMERITKMIGKVQPEARAIVAEKLMERLLHEFNVATPLVYFIFRTVNAR